MMDTNSAVGAVAELQPMPLPEGNGAFDDPHHEDHDSGGEDYTQHLHHLGSHQPYPHHHQDQDQDQVASMNLAETHHHPHPHHYQHEDHGQWSSHQPHDHGVVQQQQQQHQQHYHQPQPQRHYQHQEHHQHLTEAQEQEVNGMVGKGPQYESAEFKLRAIDLSRMPGVDGRAIGRVAAAAQLGIHESSIRQWEQQEATLRTIQQNNNLQNGIHGGDQADNSTAGSSQPAQGTKRKTTQGRTFTAEFKIQAIDLSRQTVEGGKGMGGTYGRCAAAAQLGIHESYIRRWERQEVTLRREVFDGNMRLTGPPKVPAQQSRNFTPNFKLKAIQMGRQIVLGGKGPGGTLGRSAAAAQLDIHESYIRRWERQEEQIKKSAAAQEGSEAGGGVDNDPNKRRRRAKGNRLSPQEENDVAAWMYKEKEVTGMLPSQDEVLEKIRAQVDPDFMNDPNDPAIRFNISRWFKGFCIRQSIRYELEVSAGVVGARQEVAYENGGQQGGHPEVIQQQQQEPVLQQVHGALVDHEQVLVTEI